jgi:hypothetical protein
LVSPEIHVIGTERRAPVQYLNIRSSFQNLGLRSDPGQAEPFLSISLKIRAQDMENFKTGEQGKGRLRHLNWEVGVEPGFKL